MRPAVWAALMLSALGASALAGGPLASAGRCAEVARSAPGAAGAHTRASSFAPQGHSRRHVFGAPIQKPILTRRHKKPATRAS